ncbi:unnamed protein product, partial [Tetraodon nigroviridis]
SDAEWEDMLERFDERSYLSARRWKPGDDPYTLYAFNQREKRAEEPPPSAPRREQGLDPSADPGSRQDYRREGKLFDGGKL